MKQTQDVDLIGRILKAIASTPHRGQDEARYQQVVVEPARALRRRWEDQRGAPVEAGEARRLIESLLAAFEVINCAKPLPTCTGRVSFRSWVLDSTRPHIHNVPSVLRPTM